MPGQMGPMGQQNVQPATYMPPPVAPGSWPTPAPSQGSVPQPFGAPPAGSGWAGASPGGPGWAGAPPGAAMPAPPSPGAFPYPAQPGSGMQGGWPSGESFGQPGMTGTMPQTYGVPPGAYAPGFGAPGTPGGPGFGAPAPKRPLPIWFTIGAAALIVVGLFLIWLTGSDWANGGFRAGIAALVAGVIVLGVFLFRFSQGYRGTRTVSLAVASVLILLVLGAAGLALQSQFHQLQGSSLESQGKSATDVGTADQKFGAAIGEFQAAGDNEDIARTYNDWGEQLLSQKKYQVPLDPTQSATDGRNQNTDGAINKFAVVLNQYKSTNQAQRAEEGETNSYLAWGDQYLNQSDYTNAVAAFKGAIDKKDTLGSTSAFPQLHQDAAKAYYGLGQQQINGTSGTCSDAVTTYQMLVHDYIDTTSGKMAQADLKKPQSVTGTVVNATTNQPGTNVRLFLSAHWQLSSAGFSASDDYPTTSDSSGAFTFSNIPTGDTMYLISYVGTSGQETITVSRSSGQPQNVVQVMPLCGASGVTVLQF